MNPASPIEIKGTTAFSSSAQAGFARRSHTARSRA
jgi:hypothetical protein